MEKSKESFMEHSKRNRSLQLSVRKVHYEKFNAFIIKKLEKKTPWSNAKLDHIIAYSIQNKILIAEFEIWNVFHYCWKCSVWSPWKKSSFLCFRDCYRYHENPWNISDFCLAVKEAVCSHALEPKGRWTTYLLLKYWQQVTNAEKDFYSIWCKNGSATKTVLCNFI